MFDILAIKISDVESAIGAGGQIHRMEPGVGRCQKSGLRILAVGDVDRTLGREVAMENEVGERLADERIVLIIASEPCATVNGKSAKGVVVVGPLAVELGRRGTDRKHLSTCAHWRRVAHGQWAEIIAVLQIHWGHHHLPHRNRIPVQKAVAPIVMRLSELALPGDRLDGFHCRIKTEVATVDIDACTGGLIRTAQDPTTAAVGAVDPVVQAAAEGVGPQLL